MSHSSTSTTKGTIFADIANSVQSAQNKWSLHDFEIGKSLGSGRFGTVYLSKSKRVNAVCALKILLKCDISPSVHYQIKREIDIQFHLYHPNILRLFGFFHDQKRLYLVLEYASGGSVYTLLKKNKLFSPGLSASFIDQLSSALIYLHERKVVHRDVKPENMLLVGRILKLADFGWATHSDSSRLKTYCGTPDYLAPEMLQKTENPYDYGVDIWAVGVSLFEFLTGRAPFEGKTQSPLNRTLYANIAACNFACPSSMNSGARELIKKILVANTRKRISLKDVRADPWIIQQKDLVDESEFTVPE